MVKSEKTTNAKKTKKPIEAPKKHEEDMIYQKTKDGFKTPKGHVDTELFFDLFGNDIRRKILQKLAKFPRYASDLAVDLGVSKQATKKHLDKLMEYGLIELSELSKFTSKKQYYKVSNDIALFLNICLTPNFFNIEATNIPKKFLDSFKDDLFSMGTTSQTALIPTSDEDFLHEEEEDEEDVEGMGKEERLKKSITDYDQLEYSLMALGKQLHDVEKEIKIFEEEKQKKTLEKTLIINRIQTIINALVDEELEKEVIFSLFYDVGSSIEGLSLEDIVNRLFLQKKKRAGVSKFQEYKPDQKTIERGQELLKLLKLLVKNLDFIRTDGKTLYFDFD